LIFLASTNSVKREYTAAFQQLSTELVMRESIAAPECQGGRQKEESDHASVYDTFDATTSQSSPLTTQLGRAMGQSPVFPFPTTLAGCSGETRQNKRKSK